MLYLIHAEFGFLAMWCGYDAEPGVESRFPMENWGRECAPEYMRDSGVRGRCREGWTGPPNAFSCFLRGERMIPPIKTHNETHGIESTDSADEAKT